MNVRSLLAAAVLVAATSTAALAEDKPVTDQEIASVVNSHMSELKTCLAPDYGTAGGKLRVKIFIEADGHVSKAEVGKASDNKKIDACIVKLFPKWSFPKPRNKQMWLSSYPITFSVPKIKVGTLTEEQIHGAIKPRMSDVTACYDEAIKKKPDINGQLDVGIAVSATGAVVEVETLSSSTGSADLDACVIAKVKTVKFPNPTGDGEASFKYPFKFSPATVPAKPADKAADKPDDKSGKSTDKSADKKK